MPEVNLLHNKEMDRNNKTKNIEKNRNQNKDMKLKDMKKLRMKYLEKPQDVFCDK